MQDLRTLAIFVKVAERLSFVRRYDHAPRWRVPLRHRYWRNARWRLVDHFEQPVERRHDRFGNYAARDTARNHCTPASKARSAS